MNQKFLRILFFMIFNVFLFLTLTLNINFLYLTLNLLIIFFLYEIYLSNKKNNETFEKIQNLNKENDINYLPASEHPIIKAAKNRLKN